MKTGPAKLSQSGLVRFLFMPAGKLGFFEVWALPLECMEIQMQTTAGTIVYMSIP